MRQLETNGTCHRWRRVTLKLEKSVVLHGGIGNQLFQWAFGHHLMESGFPTNFVFYNKVYEQKHANEFLQTHFPVCEHGKFKLINLPKNKLLKAMQDPTNPKNPFSKIPLMRNRISNNLDEPFKIPSISQSHKLFFGYYQDSTMVRNLHRMLIPELTKSLEMTPPTAHEIELVGSEVIHLRLGDLMTMKNRAATGVLDLKYYQNLPAKSSRLRVVVTDDLPNARVLLKDLKIDHFFGPEEFGVKSALGVMARSSLLFTANSTLSWWGGVIAQHLGGTVFIPEPFYRNVNPRPSFDTYHYPGFIKLPSSFLP